MADHHLTDDDGFRGWIAPIVEEIRHFAVAVRGLGDLDGRPPGATSPAMEEVAEGVRYQRRTFWDDPVHDAHMFGGMTLLAASDYLHGFADLFAGPQMPLYSYLGIARAALESSVVAAWLSEPGVNTMERMKRGLCELIYSAAEVKELEMEGNVDAAARQLADWQGVAAAFGWSGNFSRVRPIIDQTKRPRTSDGIRDLLGHDAKSRIGDLLFSRLSAVSHVTWFGLQWALDTSAAVTDELTGLGTVPVGADSKQVSAIALYVVRALREAAQNRVTLMGWSDVAWEETCASVIARETKLMRQALA